MCVGLCVYVAVLAISAIRLGLVVCSGDRKMRRFANRGLVMVSLEHLPYNLGMVFLASHSNLQLAWMRQSIAGADLNSYCTSLICC